jgi:Predicted ATPases of PP-loop superfamily
VTREDGRASLQGVRREVLQAQARAAGLPLLEASIPAQCDNATYAAAMQAVLEEAKARWPGIRHAAFGDLFLEDIRAWREQRLAEAGWELLVPLFGSDTAALAREMQAGGLRARLSCVDTAQLDAGFAGRDFDADFLEALPAGVDPCGENGEFHSCVWAGPMFAAPLQLERGGTELRDGRYAVTDYRLAGQAG